MEDRQIMELYFSRNERAIEETAKKYEKYCFTVAYNILSNDQDAEECVNDVWLKAWNSIPPNDPDNFRLFLAKITRNIAIDRIKSAQCIKRGGGSVTVAFEELDGFLSDRDDEASYSEEELIKLLNSFLRALSVRDCNVFLRRYFYFESVSDIASKYALTKGNVEKILSRTRKKLKEYLRSEGYTL